MFIFGAMCRCFQDNRLLNKWTFDPAELSGLGKMGHRKSGIPSNLRLLVFFCSICLRVNVDRLSSGSDYADLLVFQQESQKSNKVLRIHPLGIINICDKFHVNQSDNSRVEPCMALNTVCAPD